MIWCVEDDASIRDIELYALRSAGLEAEGFTDGAAGLHGRSGDGQLIPELLLLDMAEIGVQCAHDNDQTGQQHRKPHRHGGAKYLFCHMVSSQR